MVKTDPELRKRMMAQRERNKRQGVSVNKSEWKKGTIRILPCFGKEVGREFFSVYYEEERKSVTCPKSFGYPDPLMDYVTTTENSGSKEAKQHLKDSLSVTREHWVPCIIRGDEGTVSAPNVRAFRFPRKTYEDTVWEAIADEDVGEDVTDSREGRDFFVSKSGEGLKTKWKVTKLDPSPLSKSKEMRVKLSKIAKSFDVGEHFFPFSLEDYEAVYQAVTGEELPPKVRKQLEKLDAAGGRMVSTEDADADDEESDDEERPMKKKSKAAKAAKTRDDDEDDEETEAEDDEAEDTDDDDEEESDEDDDSDDEESDDEESDDDSDEDDEDDEEEDEKPAKGKKKSTTKKSKKSKDDDEESDDDSDDEEESDDDSDDEEESDEDDDSDDDDAEEDDDEEESDEDDDSDDDSEEDEEAEEAAPAVRGGKVKKDSKSKASKTSKASPRKPAASKPKVKPGKVKPAKGKTSTKGKVSSRIKGKR